MKKLILISLLIVCTATSCVKHNYSFPVKEIDYVNQSETTIEGTPLDWELPLGIYNIAVCDSFFLVLTHDPSAQLWVYSKQWDLLGKFCGEGRARNEIISPRFLSRLVFTDKDGNVSVPLGRLASEIKLIDITQSLKEQKTIVSSQIDCDAVYYTLLDNRIDNIIEFFAATTDLTFTQIKELPFFLVKRDGNRERIELYNSPMNLEDAADATYFYHGWPYKHPTRNLVVQPLIYLDYIIFMDIDNGKYYGIHQKGSPSFDDHFVAVKEQENEDGTHYLTYQGERFDHHYHDIFCSEQYLMVLSCAANFYPGADAQTPSLPELQIFDWEGNLLRSVKLAQQIRQIVYDSATSTLYGLDRTREHLYSFDLK